MYRLAHTYIVFVKGKLVTNTITSTVTVVLKIVIQQEVRTVLLDSRMFSSSHDYNM